MIWNYSKCLWLGDKNLFQTFSDPIDCDVQEIRELLDADSSDGEGES